MKWILSQCPWELGTKIFEKSGPEGSVFSQVGISYSAITAALHVAQRLGIVSSVRILRKMFLYGLLKILSLLNMSGPSALGAWMLQA